jgi:hypothetical protein
MSERVFTLAQAAARSTFSIKTLRRAIAAGKLVASQPGGKGGRILVSESDLVAWLRGGASIEPSPPVSLQPACRPYVPQMIGAPKPSRRLA